MANKKIKDENPIDPNTLPADFVEIKDSRLLYKPEECGKHPVRGIMLGTMQMNPAKGNENENNKEWTALVVKLTAPCVGVESATGEAKPVAVGEEILVGGYDLNSLYKAANNELDAFEVYLVPTNILAIGGGREMWQYKKMINPKGINRKEHRLFFFGRARPVRRDEMVLNAPRSTDADIPF